MPGLIHSTEYEARKAALSLDDGAARAIDAAEWKLQCSADYVAYEKIAQTPRGAVLAYTLPATERSPAIVIVFGFENFRGDDKLLLLDVKIAESDADTVSDKPDDLAREKLS
jgi:hypothetical protein